ncbi:hypothetical protein [Enterococcus sp. AZ109]|uniref:hypothetical protein n=1 Tax=Enterococcus sp. AZ109 TaxID=2774634 RepID=UPI003F1EE714
MIQKIKYFDGEKHIEYKDSDENVAYISYRVDKATEIGFSDGSCLKITSPFLEYQMMTDRKKENEELDALLSMKF